MIDYATEQNRTDIKDILKEGNVVEFEYKNEIVIAMVFRESIESRLKMVALNRKCLSWSDIESWENFDNLNEFKVLPKGTAFTIV